MARNSSIQPTYSIRDPKWRGTLLPASRSRSSADEAASVISQCTVQSPDSRIVEASHEPPPHGCVIRFQRPTAFPKPSPGQSPGKSHPKTPFRPEGADQTTGGVGPPFQDGCDDRHAVPRALPSAGFGHALRAIRFRVPFGDPNFENAPSQKSSPRYPRLPRLWIPLLFLALLILGNPTIASAQSTNSIPVSTSTNSLPAFDGPLDIRTVLDSIATQYPPYLAALIERDVAEGRLRSAGASFDLGTFARVFGNPRGYYESTTFETGVEQFLGIWGSTVFGGYRLTEGEKLPDYYGQRTQSSGEFRAGLRLPLLQDGSIDMRRAAILRARLDKELADPSIRRQQLDFLRAGMVAYYNWLIAGRRLQVAEDILRIAQDRQDAITRQIERGLSAPIVRQENQQLVVSRELGVVRARRRFEAASLALSLFYRDGRDRPVVVTRSRLPNQPPPAPVPDPEPDPEQLQAALLRRPEIRQLELSRRRLEVDQRLARNGMLPRLDAGAEVIQPFGDNTYSDRDELELKLGLEFRMPLQRSQARGAVQETQGRVDQIDRQAVFARDRILTEIRNTHEALVAAHEQVGRASLNVDLARSLQKVEQDRFQLGAADLLALQIREQAAFQAQTEELDALELYFISRADLLTALALDVRTEVGPQPAPPTP